MEALGLPDRRVTFRVSVMKEEDQAAHVHALLNYMLDNRGMTKVPCREDLRELPVSAVNFRPGDHGRPVSGFYPDGNNNWGAKLKSRKQSPLDPKHYGRIMHYISSIWYHLYVPQRVLRCTPALPKYSRKVNRPSRILPHILSESDRLSTCI